MKRFIVVLGVLLVAGVTWAAVTATPVFVQTPKIQTAEIVRNMNPSCTAANQPYACCTAANTGASCTTLAASTDAAPVWQTVYTGGSTGPGSKITGLWIVSTDAVTHTVTCVVNNNGFRGAGFAIATGTTKPGYAAGVPAINAMSTTNWPGLPVDSDGNPYLYLTNSSDKIDCRHAGSAITNGTSIGITVLGADF